LTVNAYRKTIEYLRTWLSISNETANSIYAEFSSQLTDDEFRKCGELAKSSSIHLPKVVENFISERTARDLTPEPPELPNEQIDPVAEAREDHDNLYKKIPFTRMLPQADEPPKNITFCCSYGLLLAEKDGRIYGFRCTCLFGNKAAPNIPIWTNDPSYKKL
jgi:hypothetical protein